jgi:regulatory protein
MDDFKKALNYSFLLLKYRGRSCGEIEYRLKQKGFSWLIIRQVVDYLRDHKYLNDQDFVRMFITYSLAKGWGPRKIDYALKQRGISPKLRQYAQELQPQDSRMIRDIAQRKLKFYYGKINVYQKVLRHLISRGFDYSKSTMILEELEVSDNRQD